MDADYASWYHGEEYDSREEHDSRDSREEYDSRDSREEYESRDSREEDPQPPTAVGHADVEAMMNADYASWTMADADYGADYASEDYDADYGADYGADYDHPRTMPAHGEDRHIDHLSVLVSGFRVVSVSSKQR